MKRLFIIFTMVAIAIGATAETTIPQNIYGVRLGKSTQKEVEQILTANGLVFSKEISDSTNFVYIGGCLHEDMEFNYLVTRYLDDVLTFVGFYGKCDSTCSNYGKSFIQKVHSKYDQLQVADSSIYYLTLTADAESMGLAKWGRKDDNSIVATMNNDTTCICIYFAESYIRSYFANTLFEIMKSEDPNFAEENKVIGVAGVKFGDSKEAVKRVMASKNFRLLDSDDHSILYVDASIGGMTYDYVKFFFKYGEGLISVNLQKAFREWKKEEAEVTLESIVNQYGRKYTNMKLIKDEDDAKLYKCGAFIDGYNYPPIFISFSRSLSKGGFFMYYVQVDYYEMRIKTLYDDEI